MITATPTIVRGDPRYQQEATRAVFATHLTIPSEPVPIWHLSGVAWHDAPSPFILHRHWAQTVGIVSGDEVWRCPCGAHGGPYDRWVLLDRRDVSWRWWQREPRRGLVSMDVEPPKPSAGTDPIDYDG